MAASDNIARTVRIVKLGEQGTDFAYWQAQSYAARLQALEQIRREYHLWKYGVEPGFYRVCAIVKRE